MKWNMKKEALNIGSIQLDNFQLDNDYMEVLFDIVDMSEDLKAEINKAIENEKVCFIAEWKEYYGKHPEYGKYNRKWSDNPVVIDFSYLTIALEAGKPITYTIMTTFHDAEDDVVETTANVTVDLSEYEDELKKAVIKTLIDRFF